MFYADPFIVGYTLPLPKLVVDFCRLYEVCPGQLSSYLYKLFLMLLKYAKPVGHEVTLDHMLSIFAPQLIRDSMVHMRPRGSRSLVVKMDGRTNHRFYENYFYVRTEHIVVDPMGFPERWNFARKFAPLVSEIFDHFLCAINCLVFVAKRFPLPPVKGICEWVEAIIPHTVGIPTWSTFHKKFGRRPFTGEMTPLSIVSLLLCFFSLL